MATSVLCLTLAPRPIQQGDPSHKGSQSQRGAGLFLLLFRGVAEGQAASSRTLAQGV